MDIINDAASKRNTQFVKDTVTSQVYPTQDTDAYGNTIYYPNANDAVNKWMLGVPKTFVSKDGAVTITATIVAVTSTSTYTYIIFDGQVSHVFTLQNQSEAEAIFRRFTNFTNTWRWKQVGGNYQREYAGTDPTLAGYIIYYGPNPGTAAPELRYSGTKVSAITYTGVGTSEDYNVWTFAIDVNSVVLSEDGTYSEGIVRLLYGSSSILGRTGSSGDTAVVMLDNGYDRDLEFGTIAEFIAKGYKFEFNKEETDDRGAINIGGKYYKYNVAGVVTANSALAGSGASTISAGGTTYYNVLTSKAADYMATDFKKTVEAYRMTSAGGTITIDGVNYTITTVDLAGYNWRYIIKDMSNNTVASISTNYGDADFNIALENTTWRETYAGNITIGGKNYSACANGNGDILYLSESVELAGGERRDLIYDEFNEDWYYRNPDDASAHQRIWRNTSGSYMNDGSGFMAVNGLGSDGTNYVIGWIPNANNSTYTMSISIYGADAEFTDTRTGLLSTAATSGIFESADIARQLATTISKSGAATSWNGSRIVRSSGYLSYAVYFNETDNLPVSIVMTDAGGYSAGSFATITRISSPQSPAAGSDATKTVIKVTSTIDGSNSYLVYNKDGQKEFEIRLSEIGRAHV